MGTKTSQLQIRVSPEQKQALKQLAAEAGLNVSQYVLVTVLPQGQAEFARLAHDLVGHKTRRVALEALQGYLEGLTSDELRLTVATLDVMALSPVLQNYVAATVEQATRLMEIDAPTWTRSIAPLDRPHFAWEPRSLRPHLMRITPLAFKRRNVFVDANGEETSEGRVGL